MISTKSQEESVKVSIPHRLHMAILKVQVDNNVGWEEACEKAAIMLDANSKIFKESVSSEAEKAFKSRLMSQLNKSRLSIQNKGWEEGFSVGYDEALRTNQIWYFCDICGEKIIVAPNDNSHKAIIEYMLEHGWGHTSCH